MKFSNYYFFEGFPGSEKLVTTISLDDFVKSELDNKDANIKEEDDIIDEDIDDAHLTDFDVEKLFKSAKEFKKYKQQLSIWQKKKKNISSTHPTVNANSPKQVNLAIGKKPKPEDFKLKDLSFPYDDEDEEGKKTVAGQKKIIHDKIFRGFRDEHKRDISKEDLIRLITQKPKNFIAQNNKIKASGQNAIFYDLTMPAYKGLIYNIKEKKFQVVKTCPMAGECRKFCYACKGGYIQYSGPGINAARMLNYLFNNYDDFKKEVTSVLDAKSSKNMLKNNKTVLRWHDAGDFMSPSYLDLAIDIAKATPDVMHYAYTKMISLVKGRISTGEVPQNFIFTLSLGGKEDDKIDLDNDKISDVVPHEITKDIPFKKILGEPNKDGKREVKKHIYTPKNAEKLKDAVSQGLHLDRKRIIIFDELMEFPDNKDNKFYWYVLVYKGNGDDAAKRWDVGKVLLFVH